MSEINNEKATAQDRKMPLKNVEASLRDQIPAKLLKKVEELSIGDKVCKIWALGNANRTTWLERQQEYLADYDEFLESSAEGPFQGASSLHLPMPFIVVKTLHARFLQAILGIDPYFTVKARNDGSVERAPMIQDLMSYNLKDWCNYRRGIEEAADIFVWQWVASGVGILKARWDCKYQRYMDVQNVQKQLAPKFVADQLGNQIPVPQMTMEEKEVAVTKKTFEGPVYDWIHPEDLLIIGGKGDPQLADSVTQRLSLTASELWTLVDRKMFLEEAVQAVIEAGPDHPDGSLNSAIKYQRRTNAGNSQIHSTADLDRYEVLESYLSADVDGSGINSEIVVWVHYRSRRVLRATYLHRINKSGERPYFKADFIKRPGEEYGIGIVEIIHPLCKELDAMHNMRVDFGLLSTMPYGFYRPSSSIQPTTINITPGALIPVDNPQSDIYFPQLGNRTAFGMQEEEGLMTYLERVSGVNDMSTGTMTGAQGPTRTASGARGLLGEMNSNLDVHLRRLNRAWKQMLQYSLHMLQQRIDPGFSFRVTGDDGADYWRQVQSQDDIAGDYDFELCPNSANSNQSIQQETAQQIMQLTGSPLDIQLGIITPAQRYEALKNFLKSMGVKDYGKYIQKPQGYVYIPSPEQEMNEILRGVPVPVQPASDHQGFLDLFQHIHDHDELLGQFSKEAVIQLAKQAQQHQQMLQALKQQQAQQANIQQMRTNAQQSQQQAPAGMNPFAGASIPQPQVPQAPQQ